MHSIKLPPHLPGMPGGVSIGAHEHGALVTVLERGGLATMLARAALAGMLGVLLLTGCVSTRGVAPAPQAPNAAQSAQRAGLSAVSAVALPSATWWTAYGDAALNQWIDRALADRGLAGA